MAGAGLEQPVHQFLGVKNNTGEGISLDSNLNISSESINGLFSIVNRNYKAQINRYFHVDASETDRQKFGV